MRRSSPHYLPSTPSAMRVFMLGAGWMLTRVSSTYSDEARVPALRDNTVIQSDSGDVSNGSGPQVRCGRTGEAGGNIVLRAVLDFDVAAVIPAGSNIGSARLELYLTSSSSGPVDLSLHRLLSAWGEGASVAFGGQGAPAEPGDATWLHREFPATFWNTPGGDFDPATLATTSVSGIPAQYAWSSPALTECVCQWMREPASRCGLMLRGDEANAHSAKAFISREHAWVALRPALVVEFTRPCSGDIAPPPCGDGHIGVTDLLAVIAAWGPCSECQQDFVPPGGDGEVGVADLLGVITNWGACP